MRCVALVLALAFSADPAPETLLLREPTVSADRVVFRYADDLWIVGRAGGEARRLTSSPGEETCPRFSPDGKWVAFTGQYEGNQDVYVIAADGGAPRRLTWHPGPDFAQGWHPDGKRVLFLTGRDAGVPVFRPALVNLDGSMPEMTAIPKATRCSFRADGLRIAYTPLRDGTRTWKRYRGGMTGPVWVYDPATHAVEEVPHVNATDTWPCWAGDTVYFASDRGGLMNVYRWKPGAKEVEPVTTFQSYGVRDLTAGGGAVAFSREGAIHLLDPVSGAVTRLRISCLDDGLAASPRWVEAKASLRDADPAPNGKRTLVEARGEIFSVPRENGDVRNLTGTPGAHDRSPAWSPDGEKVAWLSDASGEYRLMVGDALGRGEAKGFDLGGARFYYGPRWSPDGKHVLFTDKGNRVAFVTLETGKVTDVSRAQGDLAYFEPGACWSPDSRWVAFEQRNPGTMYDRIALFELASGATTVVTDGFAAAFAPAFSRDGRLLWFVASVDSGPARFNLDLSASAARRHVENLYAVVLQKAGKSPLAPKVDEGKDPPEGKSSKASTSGSSPCPGRRGTSAASAARRTGSSSSTRPRTGRRRSRPTTRRRRPSNSSRPGSSTSGSPRTGRASSTPGAGTRARPTSSSPTRRPRSPGASPSTACVCARTRRWSGPRSCARSGASSGTTSTTRGCTAWTGTPCGAAGAASSPTSATGRTSTSSSGR
jgi:tricorn protease